MLETIFRLYCSKFCWETKYFYAKSNLKNDGSVAKKRDASQVVGMHFTCDSITHCPFLMKMYEFRLKIH